MFIHYSPKVSPTMKSSAVQPAKTHCFTNHTTNNHPRPGFGIRAPDKKRSLPLNSIE